MNRRDSLKALTIGTLSTEVLLKACKPKDQNADVSETKKGEQDRPQNELDRNTALNAEKFLRPMRWLLSPFLQTIIIPKDG